jgi:hypothetical protein
MKGFCLKLLFRLHNMLPEYLEEVKETGKLPSNFPSPLGGAEQTLRRIFEVVLAPGYIEEIEQGQWIVTPKGEAVLRDTKPGASKDDLYALNRAING